MTSQPNFSSLCTTFLEIFHSDPAGRLSSLGVEMLACLAVAPPHEIRDGLHALWPLMRHVTREHCWRDVVHSLPEETHIREEIYEAIYGSAAESSVPITQTAHGAGNEGRTAVTQARAPIEPRPAPEAIAQFVGNFHRDRDPLVDTCPSVVAYDDESYWNQYSTMEHFWSSAHFTTLRQIAPVVLERIGEDDVFWAVLGPIYDALSHDRSEGFADEIENGRQSLVQERIEKGVADLYDHWLSLATTDDDDDRWAAAEGMLAYLRGASSAECEGFFLGLDMQEPLSPRLLRTNRFEDPEEANWPNAEDIWLLILKKTDLSLWLLARAGFYFWHSSRSAYGPSVALAALGVAIEQIRWMVWHEMVPFLPLWAAARSAADEQRWELSAHYLNRALLDVALYVNTLTDEQMRVVEDWRFDVRFIGELLLRLKDDIETARIPLLACVRVATKMCRRSGLHEWTKLRRTLEDLAWKLKTGIEAEVLEETLGDTIRKLEIASWDRLVAAEVAWERMDFNAVGNHYRSAVEHEWRQKIGRLLTQAGATNRDLSSLGKMMVWLISKAPQMRDPRGMNSLARSVVAKRLGATTRLLEREFLERSLELVTEYLDPASHGGEGLDRRRCEELKHMLFQEGFLRTWLEAVQIAQ